MEKIKSNISNHTFEGMTFNINIIKKQCLKIQQQQQKTIYNNMNENEIHITDLNRPRLHLRQRSNAV